MVSGFTADIVGRVRNRFTHITFRPPRRSRFAQMNTRVFTPVVSPEYGAHVVVATSFGVGVAVANTWNMGTAFALLSLVGVYIGHYPLLLMLRARRITARWTLWSAIYGAVALAGIIPLVTSLPLMQRLIIVAVPIFAASMLLGMGRHYRSLTHELIVFAGLSLAAPWALIPTRQFFSPDAIGLWFVVMLAFWSAVFAVRVRSRGLPARLTMTLYLVCASLAAWGLVASGLIPAEYLWILAAPALRMIAVFVAPEWWTDLPITWTGIVESSVAVGMVVAAV